MCTGSTNTEKEARKNFQVYVLLCFFLPTNFNFSIAINIFVDHYCLLFCSAMYNVYINDNNFHESMKCASFECEKKTEKGLTYSDPKMITTYNGKTKMYDKHKLLPLSKLMKN